MNHHFAIATLSELLAVTRESETGFSACARSAQDRGLASALRARASRQAAAAAQISDLIDRLGGDPRERPRVIGASRRAWTDLESVVRLNDDDALLAQCEHGEDHALEIYRNALDDHLPDFVQQVIQRQFEDLVSEHDRIRDLRGEPLPGGGASPSTGGHARP